MSQFIFLRSNRTFCKPCTLTAQCDALPCCVDVMRWCYGVSGRPLAPVNCSMARLPGQAERPAELRLKTPVAGFGTDPHPAWGALVPVVTPPGIPPPDSPPPDIPPPPGMLRVDCRPPPSSGLPEYYQMHLLQLGHPLGRPRGVLSGEGSSGAVRYNLTLAPGAPPVWELPWAPEAGAVYSAHLFAVNAKGRSEPAVLSGGPLRGPEAGMMILPSPSRGGLRVGDTRQPRCHAAPHLKSARYTRPDPTRPRRAPLQVAASSSADHQSPVLRPCPLCAHVL